MFPTPTPDANVIRYRVFFPAKDPLTASSTLPSPSPLHTQHDHAFVTSKSALYATFMAAKVRTFLWHKHAMHLRVAPTPSPDIPSCVRTYCLEGATSVGDAIDDEWVITWVLFQLTVAFPDDDVLVQVHDTDGEFLLIECADVLPEWVSPENSANRVFVRRGNVHLVSVDVVPEVDENQPNQTNSTNAQRVWREAVRAVYDDQVPTHASAAMQRTLQQKLSETPRYMQTNRHRARCHLSPKAAWVLTEKPEIVGAAVEAFYYREPREAATVCNHMKMFPPETICTRIVTMSRCQYAQLKQQRFFPPKPFLHLPGAHDMMAVEDTRMPSPEARATEIGVKLACGLELLCAAEECNQFGTPWRQIVDETVSTMGSSDIEGAALDHGEEEDDDAWLYVHPDSLEEKLQRVATRTGHDEGDTGGADELQNIAKMFNNFLGGVSGVDGVEPSEPVQLDMGAFMKLLNGGVGGGLEEDLDDDDEWNDPENDDEEVSSIDSDDEVGNEIEDEDERIMREAMNEMDAELSCTILGKTFAQVSNAEDVARTNPTAEPTGSVDNDVGDKPLDLDFNLLSNLLESMASQEGLAGPVSNILSELSASSSR